MSIAPNRPSLEFTDPNGEFQRVHFDQSRFLLGRDDDVDIQILEDSVSRRHCEFILMDGSWFIRDLWSTYGTMVNGNLVSDRQQLASDDVIMVGDVELSIRHCPSSGAGAPIMDKSTDGDGAVGAKLGDQPSPTASRNGMMLRLQVWTANVIKISVRWSRPPEASGDSPDSHLRTLPTTPVAAVLSSAFSKPTKSQFTTLAFTIIGLVGGVQLLGRFFTIWKNPIWLEFAQILLGCVAICGAYALVTTLQPADLQASTEEGASDNETGEPSQNKAAPLKRVWLRIKPEISFLRPFFLPPLAMMGVWCVLSGFDPPGNIRQLYFAALAPVRMLAYLGVTLLLIRAAYYCVTVPIIRAHLRLSNGDSMAVGRRILSQHFFFLLESVFWISLALFMLLHLAEMIVVTDFQLATYLFGPKTGALYSAAPAPLRGLLSVPGFVHPFGPSGGAVYTSAEALASSWMVLVHALILLPLFLLSFLVALMPFQGAIRHLLIEPARSTVVPANVTPASP